jgi:hypothetical protein
LNRGFRVDYRLSVGNMHIRLIGEFSGMCAWELIKTIRMRHSGPGRIFVDTNGLSGISPEGTWLFKSHMTRYGVPSDWLYFKGPEGFKIAPDGARVIVCGKAGNRGDFCLKALTRINHD